MSTDEPDDMRKRPLGRTLRELPLRRAPPTLEARVWRELDRRAKLPWWRRSFAHWPTPARGAFLVGSSVLAWLAFLEGISLVDMVASLGWARRVGTLLSTGGNLAALLARAAPPDWVYQGIAVCAVLYAILFGLGATLYRTLYLQSTARSSQP